MCWSLIGDALALLASPLCAECTECREEVRGETRPFWECQRLILMQTAEVDTITCLAHLRPQLLQRSLLPLGPRLHSGVCLV
jgi:hypothetical protein